MEYIIIRYLQGIANPEEKEQLYKWLQADKRNKQFFLEYQAIWGQSAHIHTISSWKPEIALRDFYNRIGKNKLFISKRDKLLQYGQIAAVILILLVGCLSSYYYGSKQTESKESSLLVQAIMGGESKGQIQLPDGTKVWLNANTSLYYPEIFDTDTRRVRMMGEAYFDVIRDAGKPFYVEAGPLTIQVLGTTFDIKSYPGKDFTSIVLLSGKVQVTSAGMKDPVSLLPGQLLSFHHQSQTVSVEEVEADDYIIWSQYKLAFEGETVETIFRKLEKWYDMEILYDPRIPLDKKLTLTVRKESPEEFFNSFMLLLPIQYDIKEDQIFVTLE